MARVAMGLALGLALFYSAPVRAGHYFIADIPDVVPEVHHKALATAGVQTTADLYDRVAASSDRRSLASRTGIPERELHAWAKFVDLMQLNGIGPKMVRLLNGCDVTTLKDLQGADGAALHAQMRVANRGNRYSELIPGPDVLKAWIEQARKVKPRLE